jgi:hypothetical protein
LRTSGRRGWLVRYPLGTTDSLRATGTVAAPLLAGFSLATLAVLLTSSVRPRLTDVAVLALVVSAASFLFCVQFTFAGLLYAASPGDRAAWLDDRAADPRSAVAAERVQRMDDRLLGQYLVRVRLTYDLGIVSVLGALLAMVTPTNWTVARTGAFVVVAGAVALELWWIGGVWTARRPRWLLPSYRDVREPPESPDG